MAISDFSRYVAWNSRIALYWLTHPNETGRVYLTVTPSSLATAAWECDGTPLTAEEAENDFVEAVREMYRGHINYRCGIESLATLENGIPHSIAFLAASVFAAYRMREDEFRRATAYFPRLAELLGFGAAADEPPDFSKTAFETLWQHASAWTQGRLVLASGAFRRYEAYPIAHAALRKVDLDRLPDFFEWASYAPGASVELERLKADFLLWLTMASTLTPRGVEACLGDHQEPAIQQIGVELRAWNGIAPDAAGRKIATVEIALDLPRDIPKLFLLARRPSGFPETFQHDDHQFDSLSEGWYEPLPLPVDRGALLLNGFEWTSIQQTPSCVLRRAGARVIAFAVSEDAAGLISRRRLLAGVECALLFHESAAEVVRARVAQLTTAPVRWIEDPELPPGWRLIDRIRIAQPSSDEVPGMTALEVDAAVEIVTRGGLRVGRSAEWLAESPPSIYVSGNAPEVTIDGRAIRVQSDGRLNWQRSAMTGGEHVIAAGRSYKRISLVAPQIAQTLPQLFQTREAHLFPVGLARGTWAILGERSDNVFHVSLDEQRVVQVGFEPVWAIRGGCALFLVSREVEPAHERDTDGRPWANVIVGAASRRVEVATINPSAAPAALKSWSQFQVAAQRLVGQLGGAEGRT